MTRFATYLDVTSQRLPQCCKYMSEVITHYLYYASTGDNRLQNVYIMDQKLQIDHEEFLNIKCRFVKFNLDAIRNVHMDCVPDDLKTYVDVYYGNRLSRHQKHLLNLLLTDRWYKGDRDRLLAILRMTDPSAVIAFACNTMWERAYENHYTLGQQLSIRITTKLIQSGLDFKHHQVNDNANFNRGWNDKPFEKYIGSFSAISDIIKRHKSNNKYLALELLPIYSERLVERLRQEFTIITNAYVKNVCVIQMDEDKNSMQYLNKLYQLIKNRTVNVLFVTDLDYYMKSNNYVFYLYNSLKFYYYCLKNKFVFESADYEILFLMNLIVALEWCNKGHLNSFTLEKSLIYNPLELSTRRLNSLRRAATQSRVLQNDSEIKIDFIQGKRIKTGTHYGHRIVQITDDTEMAIDDEIK
ncbi:P47 [Alphabaculovirus altermyunipunctae]|uniref:P47 n=1 Tax=Mythimna unipuncta nucleopolyhedrovirus TaxID=447897 RepID=A0A346TPH3_9ABAC|nr:P47 [Mythimna unipuncta nucleopolyhedrovirus]AXU41483.1 P47 [Mythimna unipuncta nucleopolyhedrovirus]